ncbi:HsdM family class I SAM-dependent methyltransferase [Streptococcus suis]|uniref:HsdM family class I SAM-dependent methyltransferase n=1 Tax=Streptococcus suis TaxID=1307 RepID=UPI00041DD1E5|nr:N-6 DNA methylase [Streptococcus suis]
MSNKNISPNELFLSFLDENLKDLRITNPDFSLDINNISSVEELSYSLDNIFCDSDRKSNGIYYTPLKIVELMVDYSINNYDSGVTPDIIDPACGSGLFLISAARKASINYGISIIEILENHIFGFDIIFENVQLSKILLGTLAFETEQAIPKKINIIQHNSLKLTKNFLQSVFLIDCFDLVLSNPPYVSGPKIPADTKQVLANFTNTVHGNPDLYIPFFELAIRLLKPSGLGAFITPNSYLRSLNGKKLRNYLVDSTSSIKLINFNSELIFDSILHYSAINFFVRKSDLSDGNSMYFLNNYKENLSTFNFEWSPITPSESWHTLNEIELNIIFKLENSYKTTLNRLDFKNGVATQRNNIFMFNYSSQDDDYYYFDKGTKSYCIEKNITRPFVLPNKTEKEDNLRIIFPYTYDLKKNTITPITPDLMEENFSNTYEYLKEFKSDLEQRKHDKNMEYWYLYGRSQGLKQYGNRLYIPYMAKYVTTSFSVTDDEVFAAGYAIFSTSSSLLKIISRILESKLFSFYISRISKPYSGGYYSTAKNMIKNFAIPSDKDIEIETLQLSNTEIYNLYNLTEEEIDYIEKNV